MTVVKLNLLIFILLHHQKERTLDIYRTLKWHYPPLAGKTHTFIYSAMKWDGRGTQGDDKREQCIFTLQHLGKSSFVPVSFSRLQCIWIGEKQKSWKLRCSARTHPTNYSSWRDSAFQFTLVNDPIQTKWERSERVTYPRASWRFLRWDLICEAIFA